MGELRVSACVVGLFFVFFFKKKKESVFGFQMLVFQHAAAGSDIGRTAALEIHERINSQIRDS